MNILEIAKEFLGPFETTDAIICLLGLFLFALWLLRTSCGTKALVNSPSRRNNMFFYFPFIPIFLLNIFGTISAIESKLAEPTFEPIIKGWQIVIFANLIGFAGAYLSLMLIIFFYRLIKARSFGYTLAHSAYKLKSINRYRPFILLLIWFGIVLLPISIIKQFMRNLSNWQSILFDNLIICFHGMALIVVIFLIAMHSFTRRLKGFGLNTRTIIKDFPAAFLNLLAIWPIMLVVLTLTMFFAKIIEGPDYQIQQHEGLVSISENPVIWARIAIAVTAVIVTPVLEELLFRGLFQTMIRSFIESRVSKQVNQAYINNDEVRKINGAWLAILITSILFAMMHAIPTHWPTLFVLGVCLGYSYEKSGSLFRPIFIHMLFNSISIIAVWIG